jgi:hypothetical protein
MIVKLLNILLFDMDHEVDTHMTNSVASTFEFNQAAFMKLAGVHDHLRDIPRFDTSGKDLEAQPLRGPSCTAVIKLSKTEQQNNILARHAGCATVGYS